MKSLPTNGAEYNGWSYSFLSAVCISLDEDYVILIFYKITHFPFHIIICVGTANLSALISGLFFKVCFHGHENCRNKQYLSIK
jgi:hypothetical protein